MRGILRAATAAGLLLSSAAFGLQAQARVVIGLGGGLVIPMPKSKFNSVESPELNVKGLGFGGILYLGVVPKPGSKIDIRFDLSYDNIHFKNPGTRDRDPKMSIRNINMDLVFHVGGSGGVRPYIMAGPSIVSWDYRTGETSSSDPAGRGSVKGGFGFNAGAGIGFGSGSVFSFFAETRYVWTAKRAVTESGEQTGAGFIPINIGVRIKPMERSGS